LWIPLDENSSGGVLQMPQLEIKVVFTIADLFEGEQ